MKSSGDFCHHYFQLAEKQRKHKNHRGGLLLKELFKVVKRRLLF